MAKKPLINLWDSSFILYLSLLNLKKPFTLPSSSFIALVSIFENFFLLSFALSILIIIHDMTHNKEYIKLKSKSWKKVLKTICIIICYYILFFYLQFSRSNRSQVTLTNLDFEASAPYFCEVTIDNPIFTKASKEEHIHVIGMW